MRIALDTNVLAHAEGVNDAGKRAEVLRLLESLPPEAIVVPAQALGELFNLLVRKASRTPAKAREAVLSWQEAFAVADTSDAVMEIAMSIAADHKLVIWDAVMLAAAAEAGCRLLLSEDLQDGFTWQRVTVVNPFLPRKHALLKALLQ